MFDYPLNGLANAVYLLALAPPLFLSPWRFMRISGVSLLLALAAEAFEPAQSAAVKAKVNAVFDRIEALLAEADRAKRQAQAALAATQQARLRADSALQQANRLINAFYFYADRFALAYGEKEGQYGRKDRVFYFIDKNGEEVPKLGRWAGAEQFDGRGFVKVKKDEGNWNKPVLVDYLLDTLGRSYRVAYDLPSLDPAITALDLAGKSLDSIPLHVAVAPQFGSLGPVK